ncbi:N-acetylmuramoyl-L-alanine amidase family protein [Baaleninema sp.]|uniref:N-acetylmuramoyl-L-alanine amidase family protein n=1 Tax=Baaleninema sp. TaxID=3101197 RepID=UPI003D03E696
MVSEFGAVARSQTVDRATWDLKSLSSSTPTSIAEGRDSQDAPIPVGDFLRGENRFDRDADDRQENRPRQVQRNRQTSVIEAIEITVDGNRLLVRADGDIQAVGYWDRRTLAYQIEIRNARLASGFRVPSARDSASISWVRAEQADPETVMLRVMPAPQVSVNGINQPSTQMLSLELEPYSIESAPLPVANRRNTTSSWDDVPQIPQGQVVVVIDPGHGGSDPGAVGIGGLSEIDIVNPMSHRIADLLEENGVAAVLTREDNRTVELEPRVQLANRLNANLFVSIHANAISMSRPDVNGIETYYYQTGGDLAATIHQNLLQATGGPDRGVRTARFYVLRNTDMPAVLVELGFVTGAYDAPRLSDAQYRELLAQAIARGILQYVNQYCPGPLCQ